MTGLAAPPPVEVVAANLAAVRDRMASAGGDPDRVVIVAVTKGFTAEAVRAAAAVGLIDIGENYAQELVAKQDELGDAADGLRWHAIGRLQTNKVRTLVGRVALWQSVDRDALAAELARRAPGAAVLVQVDLAGLPGRGGCRPDEVPRLVAAWRDRGLDVQGLMGVGAPGPAEGAREGFRRLRALADELTLPVRSMGMSSDLEVAIEEGATMVRLGTALFGARPRLPDAGLRH